MTEMWDIYDADKKPTGEKRPRGSYLADDEYRLAVQVWIRNTQGCWLISRVETKSHPLMWETTGGCVVAGENSLQGALREAWEELGVQLDPEKGFLYRTFRSDRPQYSFPGFLDVWVFENDTPIEQVVLQPEETCGARWATAQQILDMMDRGEFISMKRRPYHKDLFAQYDGLTF